MPLHVDDAAVERTITLADADQTVRAAFAALGRGEAATTQRVRAASPLGMASAMAAVVPPYSGGKLYATNDGRFTFVNVLFDVAGNLLATLDGDAITRLRTPAASALAIELLARPGANIATVVGAGIQSWTHIQMLAAALPDLEELRLCARPGSSRVDELAERARSFGVAVNTSDDIPSAVEGAHVVVTLTSARTPLFPAAVVSADTLICAVGATKADRAEIGPDVVERCGTVVCDDVVGSRSECGDLIQAANAGRFDWSRAVELATVAAGLTQLERAGDRPVLFETQGVAIQDVAVSGLVWERLTGAAHAPVASASTSSPDRSSPPDPPPRPGGPA